MAFPFSQIGLFGRPKPSIPRPQRSRRRWFTPARARRHVVAPRDRLIFDALESRVLLNADVLALDMSHGAAPVAQDHQLLVQLVQQTTQVQNTSVAVQNVQIVDQTNGGAVLAFGALKDISAVSINLNNTNNTVTIDANSFKDAAAPTIAINGNGNSSNVVFDNAGATQWSLTGANSGTVTGGGVSASFTNVGNLTGAANNDDTLTVQKGGTLSGTFDGGAGGFDSLVFANGPHDTTSYDVTGTNSGVITQDGQSFAFAGLEPISLGATNHVVIDGSSSASVYDSGSTTVHDTNAINATFQDIGAYSTSNATDKYVISPTAGANTPFEYITFSVANPTNDLELTLGSGSTLHVGTVSSLPGNLVIDQDSGATSSSVVFDDSLTLATGKTLNVSLGVDPTSGVVSTPLASSVTQNSNAYSISATSLPTSITVSQNVTLSASSIVLHAASATNATIDATSNGSITSATITTANTATIDLEGILSATGGAVVLGTNVALTDVVTAPVGKDLTSVTLGATDVSTITLGSMASIHAATVDAEAVTSVNATVNAGSLTQDTLLNTAIYPSNITFPVVSLATTVTNTTSVSIAAGASIVQTGSGSVAGKAGAVVLAATDATNVSVNATGSTSTWVPVLNNAVAFLAIKSDITLDRATSVTIGNPAATAQPIASSADTIQAAGAILATATSSGSLATTIVSDSVGVADINAGSSGADGDDTTVNVDGVHIEASGLTLDASSATSYSTSAHIADITMYGATTAAASEDLLALGAGGASVLALDGSSFSSLGAAVSFDGSRVPGNIADLTVAPASAINLVDKSVSATVSSSTITANGDVVVRAVNAETLAAFAEADAVTAGASISLGSLSIGGTFAANIVLGGITASVTGGSVTTTVAGALLVTATDGSNVDAVSEAGSGDKGSTITAAVAGAIAVNVFGYQTMISGSAVDPTVASLLGAATSSLIGPSYFSSEAHADVKATVTNTAVSVVGQVALTALGVGIVNSTVSNTIQVNGTSLRAGAAVSAGAILATNKLSRQAIATLSGGSVSAGGAVNVRANDDAEINSNATLVTSDVISTDRALVLAHNLFTDTPSSTFASTNSAANLQFGNTVQLTATYNDTPAILSTGATTTVTVHTGDTVYDDVSGNVYLYSGSSSLTNFNLQTGNYTATGWSVVKGVFGHVYSYLGTATSGSNLSGFDYTNLELWKDTSADSLISTKPDLFSSKAISVGGILVINDVHGGASATIQSGSVTQSTGVVVSATSTAVITATTDATATVDSGSSTFFGSSSSLAFEGSIATNFVVGNATATVDSSSITSSGGLSVTALNQDNINSTNQSLITENGSGTAVGAVVAFNAIGYSPSNVLFDSLDVILESDVTAGIGFGVADDQGVTATVSNSTVQAGGAVAVTATDHATIVSTISNDSTGTALGMKTASAAAYGVIVTSNVINEHTHAYLTNDASVTGTSIGVSAVDSATVTATSAIQQVSSASTDGGRSLVDHAAADVLNSYKFTDQSGSQSVSFGDIVYVAGHDYQYMGQGPTTLNLATTSTDYTNLDYWKALSSSNAAPPSVLGSVVQDIEAGAASSSAINGLIVRNDVRDDVAASITQVTLASATAGAVSVSASDAAAITATEESAVSSNSATSIDVVTNMILVGAAATISGSHVTQASTLATDGVSVTAMDTATISSLLKTELNAGSSGLGIMVAVNTIGYNAESLVQQLVDTVIGDSVFGSESPDVANATITDAIIGASGGVTVQATSMATITSVAGAETPVYGTNGAAAVAATGVTGSADALLAGMNRIAEHATASIVQDTGKTTTVTATGVISVSSTDNPTINATSTTDLTVAPANTTSLLDQEIDNGLGKNQYTYTSASGQQTLNPGDVVRVSNTYPTAKGLQGELYQYVGASGQPPVALGTQDYTNTLLWKHLDTAALSSILFPHLGSLTQSKAKTLGAALLYNSIDSYATAIVTSADLEGAGGVALNAVENAQLEAYGVSNLSATQPSSIVNIHPSFLLRHVLGLSSSSNGSTNAVIATNDILGYAQAYATGATLRSTGGNVSVVASNTLAADATFDLSAISDGSSKDVLLAFNSMGWAATDFVENALSVFADDASDVDANLHTQSIDNSAYIKDSVVSAHGDLTVQASADEQLNATYTNSASSTQSELYAPTPPKSVPSFLNASPSTASASGLVLSSNKVAANATAYIDNSDLPANAVSAGGKLTVNATNNAGIYSNIKITDQSTATADGGASVLQNEINHSLGVDFENVPDPNATQIRTLAFGQTVRTSKTYDKPTWTVNPDVPAGQTQDEPVHQGDVVQAADGTLYRYLGTSTSNANPIDIGNTNFANDPTDWAQIGGTSDEVYQYMGTGGQIDLNNQDYSNVGDWKLVPATSVIPQGINLSNANATEASKIITLNDIRGATTAYVLNATITATGAAAVTVMDTSTIESTNDAIAVVSGGSSISEAGKADASNGVLATNLIKTTTTAYVQTSSLTSTGGSIAVEATDDSSLTATNTSTITSGSTGKALVLAFNTVGWDASNLLFDALDTLAGDPLLEAKFGPGVTGANVSAYVQDSALSAHVDLNVLATEHADINATTDNASTNSVPGSAAGIYNESSTDTGATITSNMIKGEASAYIDNTNAPADLVTAGGALTVHAEDSSTIEATNTLLAYSVAASDGGQSVLTNFISQALDDYQYTTHSGVQTVMPNELVRVAPDYTNGGYVAADDTGAGKGSIYEFVGTAVQGANLNLGSIDYATDPLWQKIDAATFLSLLPHVNVSNSDSSATGGLVVHNDVRSSAIADVNAASLTAGGALAVTALQNASITAIDTSSVTADGGSPFATEATDEAGKTTNENKSSSGGKNFVVVTNTILDNANAVVTSSSLKTTAGGGGAISVTADNTSTIAATLSSSTESDGSNYGAVLAFNTIGLNPSNVAFEAVDALFGTSLASEAPDTITASVSSSTINADGSVLVRAKDTSTVTSTIESSSSTFLAAGEDGVSGSATSQSGTAVDAVVAFNHTATFVSATVDDLNDTTRTSSVEAHNGDITIDAEGNSIISSSVDTPVLKVSENFAGNSSGSSISIGLSIDRNITDTNVSAAVTNTSLTADQGDVLIEASSGGSITATASATAVSAQLDTTGNGSLAVSGGGAVVVNTILGSVSAQDNAATIVAHAGGGFAGNVAISALNATAITADVTALSASASVSTGGTKAVAIGASVALNLIGWRGTVVDETQDSHYPIVVAATASGGSITADGGVSASATSTSIIEAFTAAVAVALAVSGDASPSSSNEGEGEPTASEGGAGTGEDAGAKEGESTGTTVSEGSAAGADAGTAATEGEGAEAGLAATASDAEAAGGLVKEGETAEGAAAADSGGAGAGEAAAHSGSAGTAASEGCRRRRRCGGHQQQR